MQRHQALHPAHVGPSYKDGGPTSRRPVGALNRRAERGSCPVHLSVVQLDDGGVDPVRGKQALHDVAHAAGRTAEDDQRVLRYQPSYPRLRGFRHVDG